MSEYSELLNAFGAKPLDPQKEAELMKDVQENVIPAILKSEEEERAAVRNLRIKYGSI